METTGAPTTTAPRQTVTVTLSGPDVPEIQASLPAGFVETPLVKSHISASQGVAGLALSAQSYGVAPRYSQSIVLSVSRGQPALHQMGLDASVVAHYKTIDGIRSETVYSFHDEMTGQDSLQFAVDDSTVVSVFGRGVAADDLAAIAASVKVGAQ